MFHIWTPGQKLWVPLTDGPCTAASFPTGRIVEPSASGTKGWALSRLRGAARAPPVTGCVAQDKWVPYSEPQATHLYSGDDTSPLISRGS